MWQILVTQEFEKRFQLLPIEVQSKAIKQEKLFCQNPFHPSLNTEKLEPKNKQVWSVRIDKKYRIIFRFLKDNKVLFLTAGSHDWIYKIKF